jgi:hypothetical protein
MRLSYDDRKQLERASMPGPGSYGSGVIDRFSAMQLSSKLENDKKVLENKL